MQGPAAAAGVAAAHPVLLRDAVQHEVEAVEPPKLVVRVVGQQQVIVADPGVREGRAQNARKLTLKCPMRAGPAAPAPLVRRRRCAPHPLPQVQAHLASSTEQDSCSSSYCTGQMGRADRRYGGLGAKYQAAAGWPAPACRSLCCPPPSPGGGAATGTQATAAHSARFARARAPPRIGRERRQLPLGCGLRQWPQSGGKRRATTSPHTGGPRGRREGPSNPVPLDGANPSLGAQRLAGRTMGLRTRWASSSDAAGLPGWPSASAIVPASRPRSYSSSWSVSEYVGAAVVRDNSPAGGRSARNFGARAHFPAGLLTWRLNAAAACAKPFRSTPPGL